MEKLFLMYQEAIRASAGSSWHAVWIHTCVVCVVFITLLLLSAISGPILAVTASEPPGATVPVVCPKHRDSLSYIGSLAS